MPLSQPSRSPLNTGTAPEKTPSKSYSVEWDYEWLDNLGKQKDRDLSNALDDALNDGVDWVSYHFHYCRRLAWQHRRDLIVRAAIFHT